MIPTMLKAALVCSGIGTILTFVCLYHTTPLTMAMFFFLGLTSIALGIVLFGIYIAQSLKRLLEIDSKP